MARGNIKNAPKRQNVFFAYPSHPPALGETISDAVQELDHYPELKRVGIRFKLWPDVNVAGSRLISRITEAIDRSAVFACDVTYSNANVAFELGYAIATAKRLWLTLDSTIEGAKQNYKRLYTGMLGAGYREYQNHHQLAGSFIVDHPWSEPAPVSRTVRFR